MSGPTEQRRRRNAEQRAAVRLAVEHAVPMGSRRLNDCLRHEGKPLEGGPATREVVARFEAERQALALTDPPSIAKVLDAGSTEAGRPYFVMELVRGSPVTAYADKHRLSTRDRVALAGAMNRDITGSSSGDGYRERFAAVAKIRTAWNDDEGTPGQF